MLIGYVEWKRIFFKEDNDKEVEGKEWQVLEFFFFTEKRWEIRDMIHDMVEKEVDVDI